MDKLLDWLFSNAFWGMSWAMVIFFGACLVFSFIPAVIRELIPVLRGRREFPDNDNAHTRHHDYM